MATIEDDSPPSFESLTTDYLSAVTDEYEKEPWENHSVRRLLFDKIFLLGNMRRIKEQNRLYWLSCKCDCLLNGKEVSNADYLSAQHQSLWRHRIQMALIVLTSPISVPVLMLWSRFTRGIWQFWQTEGSLFVKKIREVLNNEHIPPARGGLTLRTAHTLFQEQRLPEYNPERDRDTPEPIRDTSHLRFKFDARPMIIIPLSVRETGYHYLHDFKLESISTEKPELPDLMKFSMFYELYNTAPVARPDLFSEDALAELRQKHPDIDINRGMFRYPVIQFFESIPSGGPL